MNKIYVAFPQAPNRCPTDKPNVSASYYVHRALVDKFGNRVTYIHRDARPKLSGNDLLVALLPCPLLREWKRSIIITNDNFETDKWKHGRWQKYGLNFQTDHTYVYNAALKDSLSIIYMTGDVAMEKWEAGHPDVIEKKQWLENNAGNIILVQPPLDKKALCQRYKPDRKFDTLRMLVYHSGWRKNATQLIDLLKSMGMPRGKKYDIINKIDKQNDKVVNNVINKFAYLAHTSVSEAFPYFANEFMCQGIMLFGHEEWWNGYGYEDLRWTYNPKLKDRNVARLKRILSDDYKEKYYKMRRDIWNKHVGRKDNTWTYFTKLVCDEVEKNL
jgi:hypothetical protein